MTTAQSKIGGRILIVDDTPANIQSLSAILKGMATKSVLQPTAVKP